MIAGGCKQQYSLKSTWLDKEITIDGSDKDWNENRRYYDEKSNTRISIYNDNDSLYICLNSMGPGIQMSIQRRGLSMWLCKTGKSEKVWGLRYPYMAQDLEGEAGFDGFGEPGGPKERGENHNEQQKQQNIFLILNSEEELGKTYSSDEIENFNIFCGFSQKKGAGLVYEIKIPLIQSEKTPYAARLSPKMTASIGFISEKVPGEKSRKKDGMGHGGPGRVGVDGGDPGHGGMGVGGPGRSGMGGRPDMNRGFMSGPRVESIEVWVNIELSPNPFLKKT